MQSLSTLVLAALLITSVLFYLHRYILSLYTFPHIPSARLARLSPLWLTLQARRHRRYAAVHDLHSRLGPLVLIAPNHVSIAASEAIGVVYGHRGGWVKSDFYDAFVSVRRGLFNTRDRAEHTRKRKYVSHVFSAKSISEFEPFIRANLRLFVEKWNALCNTTSDGAAHGEGSGSSCSSKQTKIKPETAAKGWTVIDCLPWFNYLAFDIIGDLAFGAPFGMLEKGRDEARIESLDGKAATTSPAVDILNRRGEASATLGCMIWLKPWAHWLPDPFFRSGTQAVKDLSGIAVARVNKRLAEVNEKDGDVSGRQDLLARLMEAKDENGEKLGREELTAEAATQLIAGSDTTSNTSCAGLYWICRTDGVLERMQRELDEALTNCKGDSQSNQDRADINIPTFEQVKDLPFLRAVINENLRIHSTASIGLARIVPPSGATILDTYFPPGTVLSVPTYTIHHSPAIWNPDNDPAFSPDVFNPDRWAPKRMTKLQKESFIPFSQGPRACVGRNVAEMELFLIFATVCALFNVVGLEGGDGKGELETREGFLRKPVRNVVGIKKRK
ncbi:MAG: hypothetical protein OHK93_002449 [Ramalina farinacea]|uniref:Cytochrome P450 n=1 Tax=Ramalina farinacea TaxID=258253 RepID=A0AA43QRD8_9LECA|nr:hypothetical protein [Ramalina farinacea]